MTDPSPASRKYITAAQREAAGQLAWEACDLITLMCERGQGVDLSRDLPEPMASVLEHLSPVIGVKIREDLAAILGISTTWQHISTGVTPPEFGSEEEDG